MIMGALSQFTDFSMDAVGRAGFEGTRAKREFASYFPGVSLEIPKRSDPVIHLSGLALGPARLDMITTTCSGDRRDPASDDYTSGMFGLMIPIEGSSEIAESGRRCVIGPQSACVVDGRRAFRVSPDSLTSVATLRLPRDILLRRYPHFERLTTIAFDPAEPGTKILRDLVIKTIPTIPYLDSMQRTALFWSICDLFGLPRINSDAAEWRLQKAFAYIRRNLGDPTLSAHDVARSQFISRRSLDALFTRLLGRPVAAEITEQRLMQAAEELAHSTQSHRTVSSIAYSLGFESPSHFTRVFTRRFKVNPSACRQPNLSAVVTLN